MTGIGNALMTLNEGAEEAIGEGEALFTAPENETAGEAGEETGDEAGEPVEPEATVSEPAEAPVMETPIPEGAMINRFGKTTKKNVNVRTEPIASAKKLTVVAKKGTTV